MSSAHKTPEEKGIGAFLSAVNTLTFDAKVAAYIIYLAPTVVQERVMLVFRNWLDILEEKYRRGNYKTEEMNLLVEATRLNEGMQHFDG